MWSAGWPPIFRPPDSPIATVWCIPEKKLIHHQIHKFVFGEEFRRFLLAGTEAMKKNKATKWLSDDRANTVMSPEDMEWGQKTWFPQTVAAGWKFWAIVQPEKVLAQMGMEQLVKDYSAAGITAKFFTDPDEAVKWLEAQ